MRSAIPDRRAPRESDSVAAGAIDCSPESAALSAFRPQHAHSTPRSARATSDRATASCAARFGRSSDPKVWTRHDSQGSSLKKTLRLKGEAHNMERSEREQRAASVQCYTCARNEIEKRTSTSTLRKGERNRRAKIAELTGAEWRGMKREGDERRS